MAKKLILLLLIIPVVVMILLFAATQTVSNLVDVPVTGIEIIGTDEFVYLDMDKNETYSLEYAVYPTSAKNKKVSVSTETFGNEPLAEFDFEMEDGKINLIPLSAGAARIVLTTISGGFRDSIVVYVESTKLQAIDASVAKNELTVGETVNITTTFLPENPSDTILYYISSNPSVASVSNKGEIRALRKGTATITVISNADENITDTITIVVKNTDEMDLGITEITSFYGKGSIPISIETEGSFTLADLSYQVLDAGGRPVPASVMTARFKMDGDSVVLEYEFTDETYVGDVTIEITFGKGDDAITKSCTISKVREISVAFDNTTAFNIGAGQQSRIPYTLTPDDANVSYEVFASNDNVTVRMVGESINIIANKAGVTEITLVVTSLEDASQVKTITTKVAVRPKQMAVTESAKEYGIEKTFTIGGYEYDYTTNPIGVLVPTAQSTRPIKLTFQTPTEKGEGFLENIQWHSSSSEVLINQNGVISFANDTFEGEVEFWASFSYDGVEEKTASYTIRCVADGVNVYSYADLYYATKAERPVILHTDIKDDFGYINGNVMYTEIATTYDKTYYQNIGKEDEAKVKILIEFKNDVFGNGHIINAHNVTYRLVEDRNGNKIQDKENALFNGPLNFVALVEDNGATVSVKAQDNICFAVYENVTIQNVELRGCDLESDADGNQDLVDLNYIGTTVEIFGDNVTIAYSRLTNGRTVLRAFGDINDSEKVIHLNITNSVLSGAREFIMRIGSNRFVQGTDANISPNLPGDINGEYNSKKEYHSFTEAQKAAYDNKYINTFVTVKNSVFKDAGIFAVGMDSHFAGGLLHDGPTAATGFGANASKYVTDWYDLAKTSYGAKLTFEGEVELYSWKNVEDVDSSTLIEVDGSSVKFDFLELNIQEMIDKASALKDYENILTPDKTDDKIKYVHAGIVFFGGGKNYSIFDSTNNIVDTLGRYEVDLADVGSEKLKAAAGNENFYFFIYDKNSTFTPEMQERKLDDESAYNCIYKK